jgi:hypothetical protein
LENYDAQKSECPRCGYLYDTPHNPNYIAPGTILHDRYIVGVLIGYNGEGANYTAYDKNMGCKVLIREYMPAALCSRVKNKAVISVNYNNLAKYYKICTNTNSISIELCDTVKDGSYNVSERTLNNAIELTRNLMKKYNIPIENVIRHFDVTGKGCPAYYVDNAKWNMVKAMIFPSVSIAPTYTSYTHTDFVKEVQAAIGAKVDGIAGNETLSKTITVSKTKNNRHAVVKPIQKYLASLGYDIGKIDGVAGAKFDKAVKEYQRANTGVIDGEITAKSSTWKKLLKLI